MSQDEQTVSDGGNMDALGALLDAMPGAPDPIDDDLQTEPEPEANVTPVDAGEAVDPEPDVNPDATEDEPDAVDGASADTEEAPAENPFSGLGADEAQALFESLQEHLNAKYGEAPADDAAPEAPEAVPQEQQQVQQPWYTADLPAIDDDILMDPAKFSEWMQHRDAVISARTTQQTAQALIPVVSMVAEAAMATMFAESEYPELKGKSAQLGPLIRAERERNPQAETMDIVRSVAQRFVRDTKAKNALAKLVAGKSGTRVLNSGNAPATPRGTAGAAPTARPSAPRKGAMDSLLEQLQQHKDALGYT